MVEKMSIFDFCLFVCLFFRWMWIEAGGEVGGRHVLCCKALSLSLNLILFMSCALESQHQPDFFPVYYRSLCLGEGDLSLTIYTVL